MPLILQEEEEEESLYTRGGKGRKKENEEEKGRGVECERHSSSLEGRLLSAIHHRLWCMYLDVCVLSRLFSLRRRKGRKQGKGKENQTNGDHHLQGRTYTHTDCILNRAEETRSVYLCVSLV